MGLPQLRDGTQVAAWMFKANPAVWDVGAALRHGTALDSWRMALSYRVALVARGHPCVLWVTGPRGATPTPGIWAVGTIAGEPYEDTGDPADELWHDHEAQRQVRPFVAVEFTVLAEPIERGLLAGDPRFAGAEILKSPRMGSPLALTPGEFEVVVAHAGFGIGPAPR